VREILRRWAIEVNRPYLLFHDFERGTLTMARSRTGQHRSNSLNRLTIATNNSADVAPTQLDAEDGGFTAWNFRKHHFIRKLDQLTDDEFEELFHEVESIERITLIESFKCRNMLVILNAVKHLTWAD
jgi:hypothetical protein